MNLAIDLLQATSLAAEPTMVTNNLDGCIVPGARVEHTPGRCELSVACGNTKTGKSQQESNSMKTPFIAIHK